MSRAAAKRGLTVVREGDLRKCSSGALRAAWRCGLALALSAGCADGGAHRDGWPRFTDVASAAGVTAPTVAGSARKSHILEANTGGCALFDYDGDGDRDLFLVNGWRFGGYPPGAPPPRSTLYRNDGDWHFADVTDVAGVGHQGWGMGCAAWDADGDGWPDLFLTCYGPDVFYRNNGDGTFRADSTCGLGDPGWSTGVAAADYDGDGDVDVYLARYVEGLPVAAPPSDPPCTWRGVPAFCGPAGLAGAPDRLFASGGADDGWRFANADARLDVRPPYYGLGALSGDFDDDGDADVYVANDATPNLLYRNDGGWLTEIAGPAGAALSGDGRPQAGMGLAAGDVDGDGRADLVVSNFSHDHTVLYLARGPMRYEDASFASDLGSRTLATLGWSVGLADFDNDADLDLFLANGHVFPAVDRAGIGTTYGQRNQVFENDGGLLRDAGERSGPGLQVTLSSRGAAFGDLDEDGDVDALIVNLDAAPTLLRNDGGHRRHWLSVELVGDGANRTALGARVEVRVPGAPLQWREVRAGTGYLSQDDHRMHFGLGSAPRARVTVRWPDGGVEEVGEVAADRHLRLSRQGGREWR